MSLVDELRHIVRGSGQDSSPLESDSENKMQAKVIPIDSVTKKAPMVRAAPSQGPSVKTGTSNDPWETL
ncbi:MAG TPA: hypothetical protein PLU50_10600 [Pseudobdellovibrionaceae bacterium]|nr:hypothetical protein [Pseudobdellovibrionaceae bacterium]